MVNRYANDAERLSLNSKKDTETGCVVWTGCTVRFGYGRVMLRNRKMMLAHRLAYELAFGGIPDGMCVLHKCDRPGCVNPEHLFLGTRGDNNRDRHAKGRSSKEGRAWGEQHPHSMATESLVRNVRKLAEYLPLCVVARISGLNQPHVSELVSRRRWKQLRDAIELQGQP